jgi:eukaryotic-like serine/threonine-protein kinase
VDHRNTLVARDRGERALALERYRLCERLGSGGFGVVWRARDELLHREVALKQISLPTEEDRERATREALASARLSHPAIVALYEACADEQDFFLISELVRGQTLAAAIAEDSLADEELLEIGIVLSEALSHAHARGVIHRDVKPHNILLPDRAGSPAGAGGSALVKLADFGGARLAGEDALTRTGDVLGTLAYMAPEQSEGFEVGPQADLYALALVLYEALSGVNPVRGPTPAATARRIGCVLPALQGHRSDLPRPLRSAIDRALAPDPRDRGTLSELREALADALEQGLGRRRRLRDAERAGGQAPPDARSTEREREAMRIAPRAAHGAAAPAEREWAADRDGAAYVADDPLDEAGWLTLERFLWLAAVLALCAWQSALGRSGTALLLLCAALPVVLLVRRPGPRWFGASLAALLGMIGLAGAWPAVAGQARDWRARALLGALGYWWLRLAEPLLDAPGRRLWLGAPVGTGGRLSGVAWESSPVSAAVHALAPLLTLGLALGALLWALAALLLPLLVRGRSALRDALAATAWAVGLVAATPLLVDGPRGGAEVLGAHAATPSGLVLGTACGAVFAVGSCALRDRSADRVGRDRDGHGEDPTVMRAGREMVDPAGGWMDGRAVAPDH